jgi:hypothetical protein
MIIMLTTEILNKLHALARIRRRWLTGDLMTIIRSLNPVDALEKNHQLFWIGALKTATTSKRTIGSLWSMLLLFILYRVALIIPKYTESFKTVTILYAILLFNGYTLTSFIYRLFFSPYASFPGPTLAAATYWYTFYYDVVKGGQYMYQTEKLHKSTVHASPFPTSYKYKN